MEGSKTLANRPAQIAGKKLHFEVSTGLKRVLGSELITHDEVAIFEMVKNSFDAGADKRQPATAREGVGKYDFISS